MHSVLAMISHIFSLMPHNCRYVGNLKYGVKVTLSFFVIPRRHLLLVFAIFSMGDIVTPYE